MNYDYVMLAVNFLVICPNKTKWGILRLNAFELCALERAGVPFYRENVALVPRCVIHS